MEPQTSAYLEWFRFLAALAVMMCHIDGLLMSNILPFFAHFGLEAVGVFFVLSGFVIAYVTDTQEKTLKIYAINRAARIYSVVIPCLALTFLLDTIGRHFGVSTYEPLGSRSHEALHILFSLSFLNYTWLLPHSFLPGSNGPFWTLCYEVPYYAAFSGYFLRGVWRWCVVLAILAAAGPYIVALFPSWLAGVGIYCLCRDRNFNRRTGWAILIGSVLLWAAIEDGFWRNGAGGGLAVNAKFGFIGIYAGALPFAASIVGFHFSGIKIRQFRLPIRWLAGASFTLYLLHLPFATLLNGMLPVAMPVPLRWAILVAATLGAAFIVAHFTERRKRHWRIALGKIAEKFETRNAASF
jgi:peptidoglycan/LPS O-acetylase OafA/YrhL